MTRRSAATVVAVTCWTGLALQAVTSVLRSQIAGTSVLHGFWLLVGYFTITTNVIVAVLFTIVARSRPGRWTEWTNRPGVLSATTIHILFVGVAYSVLLRSTYHPKGLSIVADELVHDVVPLLVLLFWWRFVPKGTLAFPQLVTWLGYPALYLVYSLGRGAAEGWYPYFFLDVTKLGYPVVAQVSGMITAALAVMSAILIAVDRRLIPSRT